MMLAVEQTLEKRRNVWFSLSLSTRGNLNNFLYLLSMLTGNVIDGVGKTKYLDIDLKHLSTRQP